MQPAQEERAAQQRKDAVSARERSCDAARRSMQGVSDSCVPEECRHTRRIPGPWSLELDDADEGQPRRGSTVRRLSTALMAAQSCVS